MYMFRSLLNNKHSITLARTFSDRKLPTVIWTDKFMSSGNKIGTKSELKEDNPNWKATKGDGKSIYDCENESWCKPKEQNMSSEWIEQNSRED